MNFRKNKFESLDSVVFMDPAASPASSHPSATPVSHYVGQTPTQLTVSVAIRRGRVLLVAVLSVGLIVALVATFQHGVELSRFESEEKNATQRAKLLDDYNSYSGNVASAFGKPMEVVVAVLVQIVTLRFLADAFTQPTASWKLRPTVLVFAAGIGYLISNAFNALNVQLRPQEVRAVVSASDLSASTQLGANITGRTTTVTHTVSELSEGNLVSNTVLRNIVLPRVTLKQDICNWDETRYESSGDPNPLPTIDFGFTQRDWQSRVLQEALPSKTLRVVVNPTNSSVNSGVKNADLPMNATLAADLFLYIMAVAPRYFPWGQVSAYLDTDDLSKRYPKKSTNESNTMPIEPAAQVAGLLPSSPAADEAAQRDWFLRASVAAVTRQFQNATNTSRDNIVMTFSHVDISPTITFDAVTFEVDFDPSLLVTTPSKNPRLTQVFQAGEPGYAQDCGPWPALCLMRTPGSKVSVTDPPQHVRAFSSCMDPAGNEQLQSRGYGDSSFNCSNASTTAIMISTLGKRFVADSITQNKSDNAKHDETGEPALIINLRKIYTFTIGRLSWKFENLSTVFNAGCNDSKSKCLGLQLPLLPSSLGSDGSTTQPDQHLVVSADALPTNVIVPSTLIYAFKPRSMPLIEVSTLARDVLLPHNVDRVNWTNQTVSTACDADIESLLFTQVNNHMYIEHGFQTAYTAATFFLFQNAAVKDTVQLDANKATLKFDLNTQDVVVWISVPTQNAWLSFAGCALLVLALVVAVFLPTLLPSSISDPLAAITAPQTIARVMLDSQQFPSMLLHRRVVEQSEAQRVRLLDDFDITELTLAHQDDHQRVTATEDL